MQLKGAGSLLDFSSFSASSFFSSLHIGSPPKLQPHPIPRNSPQCYIHLEGDEFLSPRHSLAFGGAEKAGEQQYIAFQLQQTIRPFFASFKNLTWASHAGNISASGLSQNHSYTSMIRQINWIHFRIVLFVGVPSTITIFTSALCIRRRNMTYSSPSPSTRKTGYTRLNPLKSKQRKTLKALQGWTLSSQRKGKHQRRCKVEYVQIKAKENIKGVARLNLFKLNQRKTSKALQGLIRSNQSKGKH